MSRESFDSPRRLGQRVRQYRVAAGLSQQALARRVRVSQPRISQIETGQTAGPLPRRTLCDLADALGVDLDDLTAGDPAYDFIDDDDGQLHASARVSLSQADEPFVGRADDVATVVGLLRGDVRLLTLVGPGGVGKTRLAVHAAKALEDDFPQRVVAVSLASCVDPGCIVSTIARGAGLRERDARPLRGRLLHDLPPGRFLLLLDNVEQALPAVAALCPELLAAYPDATLLVTSRAPLIIRAEHHFDVHPLGLPDVEQAGSVAGAGAAPAVELFVRRAQEVIPQFALTDANVAQVAAICRRLDGLPLAIELAAARVRVFSPGQLLRQLDRRLAFLTSGSRDAPVRQQSLRASIEWSFDLLAAEQQALLPRLAVFAGGFTLEAATEIAGDGTGRPSDADQRPPEADQALHAMAESLTLLLDQHLLTRIEQGDGAPRFGMLETIHDYARERLETAGHSALFAGRHLARCVSLAEEAALKVFTAEEATWLHRLRQEDANLQGALGWAFGTGREVDLEAGLRLAGALADYWYVSGQLSEGRGWLTRAVWLSADRAPSLGQARSLVGACLIEQVQAAAEPARAHGEQALTVARVLGDWPTIGRALLLLGNLAMMQGDLALARSRHEEALACFDRLGDRASIAVTHINLGMDFYRQGDLARAAGCADDALAVARAIGDLWDTIVALRLKGDVALARGDLDQATALYAESLTLGARHGSDRETADSLSGIGAAAATAGELERAARFLGAAETLYRRLEISIPPPLRPDWPAVVSRIRDGLADDRFAQIWGTASPEQAVVEVIGLSRLDA